MTIEEQLIERKHKEHEDCINRLQDLVQKRIVPIDPVFVIGELKTIDAAIEWYINKLENHVNNKSI